MSLIRTVRTVHRLNSTLLREYENGRITSGEYYRQCVLNFYKKSPPKSDTFFQLKAKENTDLFAELQAQSGISIQVGSTGYTLKYIYEDKEQFSVTDTDFYSAVDRLFNMPTAEYTDY